VALADFLLRQDELLVQAICEEKDEIASQISEEQLQPLIPIFGMQKFRLTTTLPPSRGHVKQLYLWHEQLLSKLQPLRLVRMISALK